VSGAEHGELDGFGPVPNGAQAVGFPPAAAPWVGYRRETCLALPRGWLGGVPIVAGSRFDVHSGNTMYPDGNTMYPVAGIAARWAATVAMCGAAAVLPDDGSRHLARSLHAILVRIFPDACILGFAGVVRGNSL